VLFSLVDFPEPPATEASVKMAVSLAYIYAALLFAGGLQGFLAKVRYSKLSTSALVPGCSVDLAKYVSLCFNV
jgi:hypothetical protein